MSLEVLLVCHDYITFYLYLYVNKVSQPHRGGEGMSKGRRADILLFSGSNFTCAF